MKIHLQMQGKGEEIKDLRRFIHGTLADRAVRKWLEQDEEQLPGQMEAYVDELWDEYVTNSTEGKVVWRDDIVADKKRVREIAKTVVRKVEPFLIARVLPYDYHPELRFKVPIQIPDAHGYARTILLNGGADIVVREPDRLSIYDLKATTNESYIHQGIMPQLIFYQIAMNKILDYPYDKMRAAFLTPYTKAQYHELTVGAEDRRHLMTRIIRFAHWYWEKETPVCANDNNVCWGCPQKVVCPKWSSVMAEPKADGKHRMSILETAKQRKEARDGDE